MTEQGTLFLATWKKLKDDKRSLVKIYDETGIPFYWLKKFRNGEIKNPSVNRVQALYEHLTGSKLKLN